MFVVHYFDKAQYHVNLIWVNAGSKHLDCKGKVKLAEFYHHSTYWNYAYFIFRLNIS